MPTDRNYPAVRKRLKMKALWVAEKKSEACADCGNTYDPVCMDYHHLDETDKKWSISLMVNGDWSKKRIQEEMDKCVLLCSNCHRLRHKDDLHKTAID